MGKKIEVEAQEWNGTRSYSPGSVFIHNGKAHVVGKTGSVPEGEEHGFPNVRGDILVLPPQDQVERRPVVGSSGSREEAIASVMAESQVFLEQQFSRVFEVYDTAIEKNQDDRVDAIVEAYRLACQSTGKDSSVASNYMRGKIEGLALAVKLLGAEEFLEENPPVLSTRQREAAFPEHYLIDKASQNIHMLKVKFFEKGSVEWNVLTDAVESIGEYIEAVEEYDLPEKVYRMFDQSRLDRLLGQSMPELEELQEEIRKSGETIHVIGIMGRHAIDALGGKLDNIRMRKKDRSLVNHLLENIENEISTLSEALDL